MKISVGKQRPAHFRPAYPEEFDLFSHLELCAAVPQALFAITTWKENGLPNLCPHAWTCFHGDRTAADNVYRGVEPLTGDDIAEAIAWIAQLPAHMNVNEIVLMPSQQACQYYVHRKS